ncbi:MAG: CDP-alcohol phosphatidyltransferase family protein [Leptospiraceae bacterium]|nr:CDP-alcohol phosphatidyltransferase family protein [Leptospiraceae bacterium]MCP5511301.1 CDP-alcohol phosphatidyltransferase family protein [Leptospiraceae bacterium]
MKLKLNWIPNALSLGNLTFGFISILVASSLTNDTQENSKLFLLSGIFIFLAAVFDGFDGMAARALNATSDLGAELDTLADLTTFGIAPGFLVYKMILEKYKLDILSTGNLFPIGMLIAAIFPICAAYRLARFTVDHDPGSFTGLPSPIAGVIIALFPISFPQNNIADFFTISGFVLIALLMVSTIRYSKPQVAIRGKYSKEKLMIALAGFLVAMVIALLLVPHLFPYIIYGMFILYVFSGIVSILIQIIQEF